jgi:hypothetical protein
VEPVLDERLDDRRPAVFGGAPEIGRALRTEREVAARARLHHHGIVELVLRREQALGRVEAPFGGDLEPGRPCRRGEGQLVEEMRRAHSEGRERGLAGRHHGRVSRALELVAYRLGEAPRGDRRHGHPASGVARRRGPRPSRDRQRDAVAGAMQRPGRGERVAAPPGPAVGDQNPAAPAGQLGPSLDSSRALARRPAAPSRLAGSRPALLASR